MTHPTSSILVSAACGCLTLVLSCSSVFGQQAGNDQLVGTWQIVVSGTRLPDGKPVWGDNPKSLLIFTSNGFYSSNLLRSDRPKFAAGSRIKGTDDENRAAVHGGIASFGTYAVDEGGKSFTVKFVGSTYPNLEGQQQTRPFYVNGDELRVTNPAPSVGGAASESIYKRLK